AVASSKQQVLGRERGAIAPRIPRKRNGIRALRRAARRPQSGKPEQVSRVGMAAETTRAELAGRIGTELGVSDWFVVDQERVNAFADVTLDHQFVHVDPERARATPFGGTIAHGLLTLSLIVHLCLPFVPKLAGTKL